MNTQEKQTTELETRVADYLKSDRQWTRPLRLAHAKLQLSKAVTAEDKVFWHRVVSTLKL